MNELMLNPATLDLSGATLASGTSFIMLAKSISSAEQMGAEMTEMLESAVPPAALGDIGGLMDVSA
jgi:hypothetical protein